MRLINTHTGSFELFTRRNIPPYATLSHTWGEDEVSYLDKAKDPLFKSKQGFPKIAASCRLAAAEGISYVWVDTCCIDQTSSAELTEALNSMYRWYERSQVCYVYLSDLPASADLSDALQTCYWFTRGWTLQELIAPSNVVFFDQDWNRRGDKCSLLQQLSIITGIHSKILDHSLPLSAISIAQKMSWAAHRATTRIEDIAYCLLGIFGIHMPLLYGEEEKAFERLQQQIIHTTPDLSIFAWRLALPDATQSALERVPSKQMYCGFLAESPLAFSQSRSFAKQRTGSRREFSVTNCGIRTQIQTLSYTAPLTGKNCHLLPLDCSWDAGVVLGVRMKKCGPDQFLREDPWELVQVDPLGFLTSTNIYTRFLLTDISEIVMGSVGSTPRLVDASSLSQTRTSVLQLETSGPTEPLEVWPQARYDTQEQMFLANGTHSNDACFITLGIWASVTQLGERLPKEAVFKVICFVVGWSHVDGQTPQISLVDYSENAMIPELLSRIKLGELDSPQVLRQLRFTGIRKVPEAVFSIPKTKLYARVFYKLSLHEDKETCANPFWRLHISSEICGAKSLNIIRVDEWVTGTGVAANATRDQTDIGSVTVP
ncbi:hypothetical protein MY11210_006836 [Beauveria gryllotalpidicola]